ncbi:MAG: PQQ-binding-like beta-propeller repeat protein [Planctomycetales bacterium]|nr:PQQ-binding-like beta-propeller repeat protein [Planctomycetales bacterium]
MNNTSTRRCIWIGILMLGPLGAIAHGDDWPHWRGPTRNGHTAESSGWEEGRWNGRRERWRAQVGEGGSSPIVVGDALFAIGWNSDMKQDVLVCLDAASGKQRWRQAYDARRYGRKATGDEGLYSGVTATPEYDPATGLLFTLGADGALNGWDTTRGGQRAWSLNLYDAFDPPQRPKVGRSGRRDYGFTSSPLVAGDWLVVEVGGDAGTLIAFDKRTGKTRWRSEATFPAGHTGGPVPISVAGLPCVAVQHFDGLLVARLDVGHEGETLATFPWRTDFANNIASVAVAGDRVLLTSSYNQSAVCCLKITRQGAQELWRAKHSSSICTPVVHGGHVYWCWRSLFCLDLQSGVRLWQHDGYGDAGSLIVTGDDRLILMSGKGKLTLAESAQRSATEAKILSSSQPLFRADAWPHVVLAGGRLYCKDRLGNLVCLE